MTDLEHLISIWEFELSAHGDELTAPHRTLIESTIKKLKELKKLKGE